MTEIIYFDYDSIRGYYCDGSMFINIERGNIKVSGSDGNDSIYNGYYSNILINGGAGDDEISNSGSNVLFKYSYGGGNDYISGFSSTSTLQISSGKVSSVMKFLDNNDFCMVVGNDTITLSGVEDENINLVDAEGKQINYTLHIIGTDEDDYIYSGYGAKVMIHGEAGDDTVENFYSYVTIEGGKGKDTIENSGDKCSILGGEDDDYIWNGQSDYYPTKGDKTSIDAGAGNDTVTNYGASVSIDGGADNDSIKNSGDKATILGGAGDDSIINSGGKVSIDSGDGKNYIYNGKLILNEEIYEMFKLGYRGEMLPGLIKEFVLGGSDVTITADGEENIIQTFGGSKVTIDATTGSNCVSLIGAGELHPPPPNG